MSDRKQKPTPAPMVEIGQTSRGYTLWRQENGAGGHAYWCDDIGGGRVVLDTCLHDHEAFLMALVDAAKINVEAKRERTAAALSELARMDGETL